MTFTFAPNGDLDKVTCEDGTIFAPKFDANGLILAIASDTDSGQVLMAAYMNAQSLSMTLETGEVTYFSRSRQKLWKKGETSGETQQLITMSTDCDQDILLLKVKVAGRGTACHTGHTSCFYRNVITEDGTVKLIANGQQKRFDPQDVYKKDVYKK